MCPSEVMGEYCSTKWRIAYQRFSILMNSFLFHQIERNNNNLGAGRPADNKPPMQENKISLKARGLLVWLQEDPNRAGLSAKKMSAYHQDGVRGIHTALKELRTLGLVQRSKSSTGTIIYGQQMSNQSHSESSEPQSSFFRKFKSGWEKNIGGKFPYFDKKKYEELERGAIESFGEDVLILMLEPFFRDDNIPKKHNWSPTVFLSPGILNVLEGQI